MKATSLTLIVLTLAGTELLLNTSAALAAEVTFSLTTSTPTVSPGGTIDYTISVEETDSTGSAGIALAVVDLVQDPNNPEMIDIPPASEGSIVLTGFNRPAGISNPGEGGASTGFIGVQRGTAGAMNLVQIGGAQNTFGQAGTIMGTDANVAAGVGQSGKVVLVSGQIPMPSTPGTYKFYLANALANTLDSVSTPPNFSPVSAATVVATDSITIAGPDNLKGDMNCSGGVDAFDIDPFILALLNPAQYAIDYPACDVSMADINNSGAVDAFDIDPFIACVLNAGCP